MRIDVVVKRDLDRIVDVFHHDVKVVAFDLVRNVLQNQVAVAVLARNLQRRLFRIKVRPIRDTP